MRFKYFSIIMAAFVLALVLSNTAAVKIVQIGPFYFDGATILFPITYIFGDILTEVYGYKRSRIVIWTGFAACGIMALVYFVIGRIQPAEGWTGQEAYMLILGQVPRIVIASLIGFWCGEFVNSFILAKMKILTSGKYLWTRTIGSTVVGQFVDTILFITIAFAGTISWPMLFTMMVSNYVFKTLYETAATPITYGVVGLLKKAEHVDYYDRETNFNPFKMDLDSLSEEGNEIAQTVR